MNNGQFVKGGKPWNKGTKGLIKPNPGNFKSEDFTDEKHPMWKGTKASYTAAHQWIARKLGKPKLCSSCGFTSDNGRQFHWSNISGKYLRDIYDWQRLCVSCHFKFDDHHIKMWITRKAKQCV